MSLPRIPIDESISRPRLLGEINHVNIWVYIGDIAIPNKLEQSATAGTFDLSTREKFWESFILTAPVAQILQTKQGAVLELPWTLLPESVCKSVAQIDPEFAMGLEQWLKLKESPADWHFDRLLRKDVSHASLYHQHTSIQSIYAVNLFEFLKEFGDDYRGNMAHAVSSAVKESLEMAGRKDLRKLGIPALAAAEHVLDSEIALTYYASFNAVLRGVYRADGDKPSDVVLVIWRQWLHTPEIGSALHGLRKACLARIEEWRSQLTALALIVWTAAFALGLTCNYIVRRQGKFPLPEFLLGACSVLIAVYGHKYLEFSSKLLWMTSRPEIVIALLAQIFTLVGYSVHNAGIFRPWAKKK